MTMDDEIRASLTGNKNILDKKLTSNVTSILNQSIQFVPASKPYENVANFLKSKYIHITSQEFVSPMNGEITNTSIKTNGHTIQPSTSSVYNQDLKVKIKPSGPQVPPAQFQIYPDNSIKLPWEQHLRLGTGVGLNNLGNTCFLNSILQVLTNTPPLINYLFSGDHEKSPCPKNIGYCGICTLRSHVQRVFSSKFQGPLSPQFIVTKIRCVMKNHQNGRQEDAHEYLRYFVDSMQTAALYPFKDRKLDLFTKETSAISRIFGGFHKNDIICNNCRSISTTFDPFLDLSLEIKQLNNIEAALQHFTRVETLSCENAYKCPKCQLKVSARKMFTIHQAPNVLTIQLKRFDHFGKIDKHVGFPEKLNIRPYMSEKQGTPVNYKLYGVVVHSGRSTSSGHYFAYIRNPLDQWHTMDDSRVSIARPEQVLNSSAYILFYVRVPLQIAAVKPQTQIFPVRTVSSVQQKPVIKPIVYIQKAPVQSVAPLSFVPRSVHVTTPVSLQTVEVSTAHVSSPPPVISKPNGDAVISNGSSFASPTSQVSQSKMEVDSASLPQLKSDSETSDDSEQSLRKRRSSSSSKHNKKLLKKKHRKKHRKESRSRSPETKREHRKHKEEKDRNKVKKKKHSKLKHKIDPNNDEPVKKFDETIKKSNEHSIKFNNGSTLHRSSLMTPLEFLKLHCGSGYGSSVKTWSGDTNSVDRNGHDYAKPEGKRTFNHVDDEWNEEFDRGRVKKAKFDRNPPIRSKIIFKINPFQRAQDTKNFDERK